MKKGYLAITIATAVILSLSLGVVYADWIECNTATHDTSQLAGGTLWHCCNNGYTLLWYSYNDFCKPTISSVSVTPNPPDPGETATYMVSASDDETGISEIRIHINEDGNEITHTCTVSPCSTIRGPYQAEQEICFYASAFDNAGYWAWSNDICFTVPPQECADYTDPPDQVGCDADPDCEWCESCDEKQYTGSDTDRCVAIDTCEPQCTEDKCEEACTLETDVKVEEGLTCYHECNTDTCEYDDDCQLKCAGTYCKYAGTCFYDVECIGSGCPEGEDCGCLAKQGEPCPDPNDICLPDGTCFDQCQTHPDEITCEADTDCDWCEDCIGNKYAGGPSCQNAGTCPIPVCIAGLCGAQCASGDSTWIGTTCTYHCDTGTCYYIDTCETVCPSGTSYCKATDDYCYYSVSCTFSGCTGTEGDYCPEGICDPTGECITETCETDGDPNTNCFPYQCTDYNDCDDATCTCPPGEYPCQGTCTQGECVGACSPTNSLCCSLGTLYICQPDIWTFNDNCNTYDTDNCWCDVNGATLSQFCDDWSCITDACSDTGDDWQPNEWDCTLLTECIEQDCGETYTCRYSSSWEWVTDLGIETACADGYDNDCDGLIDGLDPDCGCHLSSVVINPCTSDCILGDDVPLTITYNDLCPAESYIQIDAQSADGLCDIQAVGSGEGYIKGIQTLCTSPTCSQAWTIPGTHVPLECQGKTITPKSSTSASINKNNYPPSGILLDYADDVSGSFKFYINPSNIRVVLDLSIEEVTPANIANCNNGMCPEIKVNVVALIQEVIGETVIDEMPCDPGNCIIKSILMDGEECASTADVSPLCPEAITSDASIWNYNSNSWEIPIDTQLHHSDVTITVEYTPSGSEGSDGTSYDINYPPTISDVTGPGGVTIGEQVEFTATVIDPEADEIEIVMVCDTEDCSNPFSGCEDMDHIGDTYSCIHTTWIGENEYWIYAEDEKGAFNADGPYFFTPTPLYIDSDISFLDADAQIVPEIPFGGNCDNPDGCPNFTKTMPLRFLITAAIKDVVNPGYIEHCKEDTCEASYYINDEETTTTWNIMEWDDFKKGWFKTESTMLNCDQYYNLHSKVESDTLTKISREKFFINCEPKLTAEPIETSLILGETEENIFIVTVWNPAGANQYQLDMTAIREDEYPLPWVEFVCENPECTVNADHRVTINVDAESSNYAIVYLEQAVRAGVFPIRYIADDGSEQLTATSTLLIFAEGLSEFSLYQFIALIIITASIYYTKSIYRRR